jgi:hypothetical protein
MIHLNEYFDDFSGPGEPARISYDANVNEEARYDRDARSWKLLQVDKRSAGEVTVFEAAQQRSVCSFAFSKDKRFLFMDDQSGFKFVRRNREYGWKGWITLPAFWILVCLGFTLLAVVIRSRRTWDPR